jgi:hypothetical protein
MAGAAAALAAGQSLVLFRRLAPGRLVGDEAEYTGVWHDPLWVRVPAYGLLIRTLMRLARILGLRARRGPLRVARMGNIALAGAGVGVAVLVAGQAGGPLGGALAALFLLTSVERALLAIHFWPEPLLGLLLLAYVLLAGDTGAPAAGLAAVSGLAVLVRLDALALSAAAVGLALLGVGQTLAPTLLGQGAGLALATLWNWRRHGVAAPDTTLIYNLAVWRRDRAQPGLATEMLQRDAGLTLRQRGPVPPALAAPRRGWPVAAAIARYATLLGRETFLSQRMLDPARDLGRYRPGQRDRLRARLGMVLGWGTTAQFVLAALLLPILPVTLVVPVAATLVVAGLVATRSRYRVTVLPTLAAGLAMALAGLASGEIALASLWPGGLAAAGLWAFIAGVPARPESSEQAP